MSDTLGCGHPDKNRACGDCLDEAEAENAKLHADLEHAKVDRDCCCAGTEVLRVKLEQTNLQVDEARGIILALHKNPENYEAQAAAVKFLGTAVCEARWDDPAKYGRETCGHVLPCPIHKRNDAGPLLCRDCGTPVHYPYDCPERKAGT